MSYNNFLLSLKFIEHSYNYIKKKENSFISEYTLALSNLNKSYKKRLRLLIYDDYQIMLEDSIKCIENIIKNPNSYLIRDLKKQRVENIKYITKDTIIDIAKKAKRKSSSIVLSHNKVLSESRRFSFDNKENQITLYLLNILEKEAQRRLKESIVYTIEDKEREKALKKIITLKKKIKLSPISESSIKKAIYANNVLLKHKYYYTIWRSVKFLENIDYNKKF